MPLLSASSSSQSNAMMLISAAADTGDYSASSTFDVAELSNNKTLEVPRCQHLSQRQRRVSFNEDANQYVPPRDDFYSDSNDVQSLWYSTDEYAQFKNAQLRAIQDIARVEKAAQQKLGSRAYRQVLEGLYRSCCSASDVASNDDNVPTWTKWALVTHSRIGLERWTVRTISYDKVIRRQELTETVLELQQQCCTDEEMAAVAMEITRPSRRFARLLAQAQSVEKKS